MKDGILRPNTFVLDTTKIRIQGKGQVDFKKQQVDLTAAPTPKKPEFFSLATPIGIQGKFSDFEMGITSGGLISTAVQFITSPLHVPFRRLAGEGLPEDGADICNTPIGDKGRKGKRQ
jgi:hypothetical protein